MVEDYWRLRVVTRPINTILNQAPEERVWQIPVKFGFTESIVVRINAVT